MQKIKRAMDLILPPRCVVSGADVDEQGMLSPEVWKDLHFIGAPCCAKCGLPFDFQIESATWCAACLDHPPVYDTARSALGYNDVSRDLVLRFKHADQTLLIRAFLPWLIQAGQGFWESADVIVPVPLHRWRLLKRRYNQAAILADAISRKTGIAWLPDHLIRVRATASQGHKSAIEREENVKGAFAVRRTPQDRVSGKNIVIVDDVYTTGATVQACAAALYAAGAAKVDVVTLVRVLN